MRIITILNNNVVLAETEEGKEVILVKSGLGFKRKKGDILNYKDVEKVFRLTDSIIYEKFLKIYNSIPEDVLTTSNEIIEFGKNFLSINLHENILITLMDHINLAIHRYKNNIEMPNPLNMDIKKLYEKEFIVGEEALKIIAKNLDVKLPYDEVGLIAMHFVNASISNNSESMNDILKITKMVKEILNITKYASNMEIDEDSMEYFRFMRHLQFLAQRIIGNKQCIKELDNDLYDIIIGKYDESYKIALMIKKLIKNEYGINLSSEEVFYLTLHINNLFKATMHKGERNI